MFKSLLLLSALLGINSMPVAQNSDGQYYGVQERQYQHTEDVGNTEVIYKYETNEVNSIDDLVVGNIYHFDYTGSRLTEYTNDYFIFGSQLFNVSTTASFSQLSAGISNDEYPFIFAWQNSSSQNRFLFRSLSFVDDYPYVFLFSISEDNFHISFDFVFYSIGTGAFSLFKDNLSSSTYNEIIDVSYTPPTTIFGHLAEVLGDNLYGGIPNVDNVIFNIGGQDVTLKSWLVTSTCIVLAVVLITILCLFIRWLFKLFSNTILLR